MEKGCRIRVVFLEVVFIWEGGDEFFLERRVRREFGILGSSKVFGIYDVFGWLGCKIEFWGLWDVFGGL